MKSQEIAGDDSLFSDDPASQTQGPVQFDPSKEIDFAIAEVQVAFPNGEIVDVTLRQYVPAPPPYALNFGLAGVIDQLEEQALKGNGASARDLFRSLRRCANAFSEKESLDSALAQLRETGEIVYEDGSTGNVTIGVSTTDVEEIETEKYEFCAGVTRNRIENRSEWAMLSAVLGDPMGARDYAREIGVYSAESLEIYENLWNEGHVRAAESIAVIHERGEITGEPDYVKSYAYSLVSKAVLVSAYDTDGVRPDLSAGQISQRKVIMDQVLSKIGSYLTANEQLEAESLAAQLLRENSNCCKGRWIPRTE